MENFILRENDATTISFKVVTNAEFHTKRGQEIFLWQ